MRIKKWIDDEQRYIDCQIPKDWRVSCWEVDLKRKVNCVNCGEVISYGKGYTSRRYHTDLGSGFCECKKCYFNYLDKVMEKILNDENEI